MRVSNRIIPPSDRWDPSHPTKQCCRLELSKMGVRSQLTARRRRGWGLQASDRGGSVASLAPVPLILSQQLIALKRMRSLHKPCERNALQALRVLPTAVRTAQVARAEHSRDGSRVKGRPPRLWRRTKQCARVALQIGCRPWTDSDRSCHSGSQLVLWLGVPGTLIFAGRHLHAQYFPGAGPRTRNISWEHRCITNFHTRNFRTEIL